MSSYIGDKLLSLVAQNKEGMMWAKWWCAETGGGAIYNLNLQVISHPHHPLGIRTGNVPQYMSLSLYTFDWLPWRLVLFFFRNGETLR